jgi:hypothetical protein
VFLLSVAVWYEAISSILHSKDPSFNLGAQQGAKSKLEGQPSLPRVGLLPIPESYVLSPPHPLPHTVHNTRTAAGSTGLSFSWPPPASQQLHHFPGSDWKGKPTFWGYAIPYLRGIFFKIKLDFWLTWISCTY